tara:strand:+ start:411 stop:671 length:261 start_codon:yes stop_codon:yes gene_type:complete
MEFSKFAKIHGGLKANVFRRDAPWRGALFGNSVEERKYVREQKQENVWTLICEGRDYFIVPNDIHVPNKLGNIITKKQSTEKIQIK